MILYYCPAYQGSPECLTSPRMGQSILHTSPFGMELKPRAILKQWRGQLGDLEGRNPGLGLPFLPAHPEQQLAVVRIRRRTSGRRRGRRCAWRGELLTAY